MVELDVCKGPFWLGINEEDDCGLKLRSCPFLWILGNEFEKCV